MNLQEPHTPNMYRKNISLGLEVNVVLKKDQRTGKRTRGKVQWILTSAAFHSRGIKVMLDTRQIGRVQEIIG
ncbi:MAG: YwbE family protein [Bacteroidota bacterium]